VIYPNTREFTIGFFIISGKLLKSARIILMVWPSEDGVVVDVHHIVAPHIVISLEQVKPGAHAIPFLFIFPNESLGCSFTTDLFEAPIQSRILFLKFFGFESDARKEGKDFITMEFLFVQEMTTDEV
jgi:hypothetical protein